ncbi:MAG TPA: insulinase family protein [Allosphingosinicella sp.]
MRVRSYSGPLARLCCVILPAFVSAAQAQEKAQPSAAPAQAAAAPSPLDDPRPALQGRLGNGLRYAIVPRRANQPGVGLLMQIEGGFLAERRPGERGLAHLIEHLVFHSPTRSAPDDVNRFRSVGFPLSLPEPAGGNTSWRESDYYLVSRTTKPADIDTLLGLLREVASELLFLPGAVDGQRAEVMREMADKKRGNAISADYIAAVAPGSPNDVIDAQNSDDVPTASIETIRALYDRVYRPENTSLVIVGDVDPRQMEALVRKRFGDWRGVGPAPRPATIPVFQSDRIAPISHSARLEGRRSAMITIAAPLPRPASRKRQAEALLMDMLAMRALGGRLARTQAPGPPGKYGIFIENGEQGPHRLIMLWDDFAPGQWQAAVAGLKRTACQLATTGLSPQHWAEAKRYVLEDLERRTHDMPNVELAGQLADALAVGRDPIPPAELLRRARTWLPTIGAGAANRWWRRQWSAGREHVRVESPDLAQVANPAAAIRGTVDHAARNAGCKASPS